MPAGVRSPAALVMPGRFCSTYIRSSKFTRLRLNAVVSALARLFATTSMRVDKARSPVAAEFNAIVAMRKSNDERGTMNDEGGVRLRSHRKKHERREILIHHSYFCI